MPPHLHPRSTATSTLFAGTLLVSFVVVAIPHILPCPSRRKIGYQDTEAAFDAEGRSLKRFEHVKAAEAGNNAASGGTKLIRQRPPVSVSSAQSLDEETRIFRQLQEEARIVEIKDRECPVPKPKTLFGRMLGRETE